MKTHIWYILTTSAVVSSAIALTTHNLLAEVQGAGFVGIVGNWSAVTDGAPAFKVDTAGWNGTTERSALEAISKSLFATQSDTFVTNGMARLAFPLAVFTETKDFTQGTIRVQFKLVGGASDKTAGIVFNLKPNGEYFFVRYNILEGNVAVWRFRNGARARVAPGNASVQLPLNAWHELTMTVAGNQLTATVNGDVLKLNYTLPEPASGRVGLWTKRDAITVFRNFQVTP